MYGGSGGESSTSRQNQQILDALLNGGDLNRGEGLDEEVGNQFYFQSTFAPPPSEFHLDPAPFPNPASTATLRSFSTTTTTTPRRGPRQSVCVRCRRSKLRCDRQWPCLHCKRHNVTCEYPGEANVASLGGGTKRRQSEAELGLTEGDGFGTSNIHLAPGTQPRLPWSDRLGWRDHLFSLFGADRLHAQRQIVSLLRRVPKWMYADHFYHFVHMYAPIQAIARPDEPTGVHPALMYAMIAYGLRMSTTAPPTGLIPREGVPVIEDGGHPANRLQREAEVMLAQTLSDQQVGVEHSLALAQAAAMVMKLQPELSERIMHYRDLSLALTQTPLFRKYTDGISDQVQGITFTGKLGDVANETFRRRASVQQEEAARVRLLSLWSSFRQGYVYANVEVLRGRFKREDWLGATVFAPFVDEPDVCHNTPTSPPIERRSSSPLDRGDDLHYDIGAEDPSGMMGTVTFKARALNSIWRCASSWQVKTLNYVRPDPDFEDILQQIDQGDQSIVMLQQSMVQNPATISLLHKTYFAKRVVAIAFLQGFLIRRIGFAHCAALRKDIAQALGGGRGKQDQDGKEGTAAYDRPFVSASFKAFLHLINTFLDELETDFEAHRTSPNPLASPPHTSHFSLDSLALYAAASQQYSDGVAQTYAILGHPDPASQAMVKALREVSNALRAKVQRHRTAHMRCGNPRRMLERAVLLEC